MIKRKKRRFKSKRTKQIIILSIIMGLLLISWIIFKILIVNAYYAITPVEEFFDAFDTRTYYSVKSSPSDNLFSYTDNIKFKNYIDDSYEKSEFSTLKKDGIGYHYYNKSDKTSINVGEEYSYVEMFKEELTYFTDDNSLKLFNINTKKRNKILEKNKINNDIDFFQYIKLVNNTDITIFTPIYKIQELASVKLFASVVLPGVDKFVVLEGDIQGYTLMNESFKEIVVLKNNKKYFIGLMGEKFNNAVYEELLSSLEIID